MSDRMKDETIAMVAVDRAIRSLGRSEEMTMGQVALETLEIVEQACDRGQLGFLHTSYLRDPDTGEVAEFGNDVGMSTRERWDLAEELKVAVQTEKSFRK